jgi:hypothetical protein
MAASLDLRPVAPARRALSTTGALLLTIAGNMLIAVVVAAAVAGVAAAGVLVFGAGLLDLV